MIYEYLCEIVTEMDLGVPGLRPGYVQANSPEEMTAYCNGRGREGWQLVGVNTFFGGLRVEHRVFWKRGKINGQDA